MNAETKSSEFPPGPASAGATSQLQRDLQTLGLGQDQDAGAPGPGAPVRRQRRPKTLLVLLAIAAVLLSLWLYRRASRPQVVELVAVGPQEVGLPPVLLTAAGYLVARRQITVSSKTQGKIIEMAVEENQRVGAGDLIARVEGAEQQAQLSLARAEYDQAQLDLDRMRQLAQRGVASPADLDSVRTKFRVAKSRLDLARVRYENTSIRAPIAGTVIRKIRDVGEFLTIGITATGEPGTAVVTLADLSEMRVELEINETEIAKVKLGGVALVTPEALPERRYLADVVEIAAMADRTKSIVPVEVRLRRIDADLKPEMTAKVAFLEREPEGAIAVVPALPEQAVATRGGREVVFEVSEGRAHALPVRTEPASPGYRRIVEGPEVGAFVVANPATGLSDGDRVEVGEK